MSTLERQQKILGILKNLKGTEPLKSLFWSELSYQRINEPLSRRGWSDSAATALAEDPVLFAGCGDNNDFHVIYSRLAADKLLLGQERPVVSRLLREHPYTLFVFSNSAQDRWHFLNVKYDEKTEKRRLFRRITIGPEERLRTATERLSLLSPDAIGQDLFGLSPLVIQQHHDEAFDVEAVTKQFFEEYKALFGIVQDDLKRQTKDNEWSHDYALQLLNRCMFLYFVQRKRWLGDDTEFLRSFWEAYQRTGQPKDSFFDRWLKILFFEAFNNKFHGGHRHFPDAIKHALALAPYLNGGLFSENDLDSQHDFNITDTRFDQVFSFLERHNFTIAEDSPLDQEVAVDPEMIGKVYESLVNVSTEADERGDAGIFYTPRTEIDLQCRLALVDYLTNHLGETHKQLLYEMVFALEPDEKVQADQAVAKAKLWPEIDRLLRAITAMDLACGSGSFLVGMLHILDDLQERANRQLAREETSFDRKKRIIGDSLYGVDVMDWACHVAELRLWLALVIDADFTREALHARKEPLLPHFTFKIRCGDSLVEEVGGINMAHLHGAHGIPASLKARITRLKTEKLKFYNNDPTCQFRSPAQAKQEELRVFREILDTRHKNLEEQIRSLRRQAEAPEGRQIGLLDHKIEEQSTQTRSQIAEKQKKLESLSTDLDRIAKARAALKSVNDVPFVWDIAFVEIFQDDADGFDIIFGNPPYVRQENISDPRLPRDEVTTQNKREYKDKLARAVYQAFPKFFAYNADQDRSARKLNAKSDLYIYFHFLGLSLLNPKGAFSFICSNSWLDVGYGADLQEFLLRQCHIKYVLDNSFERSFDSAEVNTVIVLLSAPATEPNASLSKTARFVMFRVPFAHIVSPVLFQELESAKHRKATAEYRLYAQTQEKLLEAGCAAGEDEEPDESKAAPQLNAKGKTLVAERQYAGDKWGGKYLRAPDIYWTIVDKLSAQTKRLGHLADVKFGIKSGANEFFHLDKETIRTWGIERKFLRPLIKTPRDYYSIRIPGSDVLLFWCQEDKAKLKGTKALDYIKWGEEQGFHKTPSCASRKNWYSLKGPEKPSLLWPSAFFERHIVYECPVGYVADKVFYTISGDIPIAIRAYLNSSIVSLFVEAEGYQLNHGGIFVTTEWLANLPVIPLSDSSLARVYDRIASRDIGLCADELDDENRKRLDLIALKQLGLGERELANMHDAIKTYVAGRIHKAKRETTQKGRQPDLEQTKKRNKAADSLRGIWATLPAEEDAED